MLSKAGSFRSHARPSFKWSSGLRWWRGCKESSCNAGGAGDEGRIPGLGRSSGVENGDPPQYSHLENSMDRGAWQAVVCRVQQAVVCGAQRVGHN